VGNFLQHHDGAGGHSSTVMGGCKSKLVCSARTIRYLCAMTSTLLVLCTCPDHRTAQDLAGHLVREGLAACVNVTAPVTSVYLWQGKLEQEEESLLLIKTSAARYSELEQALRSRHPYELPEIIAVPIEKGSSDYLQWVEQCTTVS